MAKVAEDKFCEAMAPCQHEIGPVARSSVNTFTRSTWAKLDAIHAVAKPIYARHGFSVVYSQGTPSVPGLIRIVASVRHVGGHREEHWIELPPDTEGAKGNNNKTGVQGVGSTFSYGRRYLECAIFNIDTGDDVDGNRPQPTQQGPSRPRQAPQEASKPPQTPKDTNPDVSALSKRLWALAKAGGGEAKEGRYAWLAQNKIIPQGTVIGEMTAFDLQTAIEKAELTINPPQ